MTYGNRRQGGREFDLGERVSVQWSGMRLHGYVDPTVVCSSGYGTPTRPWEDSPYVPVRFDRPDAPDTRPDTGWQPSSVNSLCPRKS